MLAEVPPLAQAQALRPKTQNSSASAQALGLALMHGPCVETLGSSLCLPSVCARNSAAAPPRTPVAQLQANARQCKSSQVTSHIGTPLRLHGATHNTMQATKAALYRTRRAAPTETVKSLIIFIIFIRFHQSMHLRIFDSLCVLNKFFHGTIFMVHCSDMTVLTQAASQEGPGEGLLFGFPHTILIP